MFNVIEEQILKQLKSLELFKGFTIDSEPADYSNYDFISERGCLLVSYNNTSFSDPQTLSTITQEAAYTFKVILGLRYLRTDTLKAGYPYLQEIKRGLTGLRISSGKLYPTKLEYIGKLDRTHYYSYTFAIKLTETGDPQIDNVLPFMR